MSITGPGYFQPRPPPVPWNDFPAWSHGHQAPPPVSEPFSPSTFPMQPPQWFPPETASDTNFSDKNHPTQQPYPSQTASVVKHDIHTMHTTELSICGMPLDEALSDFKTDISPWQNPSGWVQADTEYINSIVQEIVTLTKRREIEQANFAGQDMIYPVCLLWFRL